MEITINGVKTNINSGNGNGTVEFSAAQMNLGNRVALQQGTFYLNATGVTPRPTIKATLLAAAEFVQFDSATASVGQAGGSVTITGKSNSKKLTFTKGNSGDSDFTIPTTYTVGGITTTNGAEIAGDPGATAKYSFSITLTNIPKNATIETVTESLIVTAYGNQTASCEISVAAAAPFISVSPNEIQISQNGSVETVSITSNTTWTITAS